jgi:lipopolysaccharide export system permease protein
MHKIEVTITDKYILKQLIETFVMGIAVFTALMFASDQFLSMVKMISNYGIPLSVAIKIVILQLPYVIVYTIPMGILLATILTFNKLSTGQELTIMRACGISLTRLSAPILIFGVLMAMFSFLLNEFVVPAANLKAKNMLMDAASRKSIPDGKTNFSFKELDKDQKLKRLFYISKSENKKLEGVTVLDLADPSMIQIVQAKYGSVNPETWGFDEGVMYMISGTGKTMNTTVFNNMQLPSMMNVSEMKNKHKEQELNFFDMAKYIEIEGKDIEPKKLSLLKVLLYEKISMPVTAFFVILVGIPLAISPPRAKVNRGLLFSIGVIFFYYLLRAVSSSLGEAMVLEPMFAAWLPNIIVLSLGSVLFYRKACLV